MNDIGYDPEVADPEAVRGQIESHLTAVKKMADLPKGKGNPPGALINTDDRGVKRGYSMYGVWSVYGLPNEEIGAGYARVRSALPTAGWRIVNEGRDATTARDPELWAESPTDHAKLILEWVQPSHGKGAVLLATIDSRIYVAPPDVDLNTKI
ncbi:hypothetical protein [Actinomadura napierensis]|uniref:Uncharacterized protein n=1 Tax=Actinomadura napierensis TaxID=267854 RepID=A0ABN3A7G4_9ACTN